MITSFEVGAVFKIVNEASPGIRAILTDIRALNKAITNTEKNMSRLTGVMNKGLGPALGETRALARAWEGVALSAGLAQAAIASASRSNAAMKAIGGGGRQNIIGRSGGIPGGGGGGGARGGGRGGSGFHVSSIASPIPGGHAYFRGGGNMALAGAGAVAYGIYEEAVLQDQIFLMEFHAGMEKNAKNDKYFRDLIQKTASQTGFGYKEIAEAATDEIRLLKGAGGKASGGLDILPEMLKGAAIETRLKPGTTLKTAMESLIQSAHMAQEYGVTEIKEMMPLLAFLSTTNPATLPQMVRAASYATPTLHSGLNVDPSEVLMMTTAIARAGATNTKSGTWVRAGIERLLPPDARLMSDKNYEQRMVAMRALGLAGADGKSTILGADGNMDLGKAFSFVRAKSAGMPIEERNNMMKKVFGEQGQRGMSLLMSDKVGEQTSELWREFPQFKGGYNTFMGEYSKNSPIQKTRETVQDLTGVLSDIGSVALPPVTQALRDFAAMLQTIKGVIPGGSDKAKENVWARVGAKALEGAIAGGVAGSFFGGVGAVPGALVTGGVSALVAAGGIWLGLDNAVDDTKAKAAEAAPAVNGLSAAIGGLSSAAQGFHLMNPSLQRLAPSVPPPPPAGGGVGKQGSIYLDGRKVGQVITGRIAERASQPLEGSPYYDQTHGVPAQDFAWSQG
ncbi:MAG: hypothetical protein PSV22_25370 [Pseudolabrys sp.]|nr:hypothetical protein [Pseudolabrys sp.]